MTRLLATGTSSRRATFRFLAAGAVGAALARLGLDEAAARVGAKCDRTADCGKGEVCKGGRCRCKRGTQACGRVCRNLNTDRANCGACGRPCGEGETCSAGFCVRVTDAPGSDLALVAPHGLALGDFGANGTSLIVADADLHKIVFVGADSGGCCASIGDRGSGDGQFEFPTGVAFAGEVFFVADKGNHRIQRFNSQTLAHELSFGFFGSGVNQFRNPSAVDVDLIRPGAGNVYVADTGNHQVKKYTLNGFHLRTFGGPGSDEGRLNLPVDVAVSRNENSVKVYVADLGNNRVQIFDQDGRFVGAFGRRGSGNGEFLGPRGIAIGADGTVFVTDSGNDRVQQFTADGRFLRAFGGPGSAPGQFEGLQGIAVGRDGTIHVAETGNDGRIQTFKPAPA